MAWSVWLLSARGAQSVALPETGEVCLDLEGARVADARDPSAQVVLTCTAGRLEGRALTAGLLNDVQWTGPSPLRGGDELLVGKLQLLVLDQQSLPPLRLRPRREHEAVARAVFVGKESVSVLLVHLPPTRNRNTLVAHLLSVVPETAWVSDLGPATLDVLLPGADPEERERVAQALVGAGAVHAEGASRPADGDTQELVLEAAFTRYLGLAAQPPPEDATLADPVMLRLLAAVERTQSQTRGWVLTGERGSGKEAFARQAHGRLEMPGSLVVVPLPATPEALGEVAEKVASGTLYVDAGHRPLPDDVPWSDWEAAMAPAARWFWGSERMPPGARWVLPVPPLRDRSGDILPLGEAMLARFTRAAGRPPLLLSTSARETLRMHAFPGNVRELKNVMATVALSSAGAEVALEALPSHVQRSSVSRAMEGLRTALRETEREALLSTLARTRWNVTRAAQLLGIPRRTVVYRMSRLGLRRPDRS